MDKKKLIMIGGGGGVLLAAVAGGLYFTGFFDTETAEAAEPVKVPPAILQLEPFLTNINDPRGQRAARLQVQLVVSPPERVPEIEADPLLMARLRDHILSLLTAKTFEELNTPGGKESFRDEMKESLSALIEDSELEQILFSDFIVQ